MVKLLVFVKLQKAAEFMYVLGRVMGISIESRDIFLDYLVSVMHR